MKNKLLVLGSLLVLSSVFIGLATAKQDEEEEPDYSCECEHGPVPQHAPTCYFECQHGFPYEPEDECMKASQILWQFCEQDACNAKLAADWEATNNRLIALDNATQAAATCVANANGNQTLIDQCIAELNFRTELIDGEYNARIASHCAAYETARAACDSAYDANISVCCWQTCGKTH